jgi:hypothetical protein
MERVAMTAVAVVAEEVVGGAEVVDEDSVAVEAWEEGGKVLAKVGKSVEEGTVLGAVGMPVVGGTVSACQEEEAVAGEEMEMLEEGWEKEVNVE